MLITTWLGWVVFARIILLSPWLFYWVVFARVKYCSQRGWQNPGVKTLENAKKNAILGKLA